MLQPWRRSREQLNASTGKRTRGSRGARSAASTGPGSQGFPGGTNFDRPSVLREKSKMADPKFVDSAPS